MAVDRNTKVHYTHKVRIKKLYREGFTKEELARMYKIPLYLINKIVFREKKGENV